MSVFLVLCLATETTFGQQKNDVYTLDVELDPDSKTVNGNVHIHWVNQSEVPISSLVFHLYLNAFENSETVFMKETGGKLRDEVYKGEGGIDFKSITVNSIPYPLNFADFELIPNDKTQMQMPLPFFLPPGESVSLQIDFTSTLPPLFARAGYVDDFFSVAQWFPKLAKLEEDGTWASFPYHGFGEFYSDFADYDLRISAPVEHQIAASGELVSTKIISQTHQQWTFVSKKVHDVVFVAWPKFEKHSRKANAIKTNIYCAEEDRMSVELGFELVELGLEYLEKYFGSYPYPELSIVIPPKNALGASGMEYPTLFLGSAFPTKIWFTVYDEWIMTFVHELVHQWFQGIVATHEVQYPWLDEGLTTWVSLDLLKTIESKIQSPFFVDMGGKIFDILDQSGAKNCQAGEPAFKYKKDEEYFESNYDCPALLLERFATEFGRERVLEALKSYTLKNRFKHPTPKDLLSAFDQEFWVGFSKECFVF